MTASTSFLMMHLSTRDRLSQKPGVMEPPQPHDTGPTQENDPSLLSHLEQCSRLSVATLKQININHQEYAASQKEVSGWPL